MRKKGLTNMTNDKRSLAGDEKQALRFETLRVRETAFQVGNYLVLREHMPYRMTYNMEEPKLKGRIVVFLGMVKAGDYRRARVRLMNPDGGTEGQQDWYVWPSLLLELA